MFSKDLKQLLDEKYLEYNKSEFFIETDPIQIPKCFEEIPGSIISMGTTPHDYQEMQGVDAINGLCTP